MHICFAMERDAYLFSMPGKVWGGANEAGRGVVITSQVCVQRGHHAHRLDGQCLALPPTVASIAARHVTETCHPTTQKSRAPDKAPFPTCAYDSVRLPRTWVPNGQICVS